MTNEKILVVDDELHIRQAVQAALESEGYQVQTAENGKEGVDKCRLWKPALVMLDIRMPVMDGHLAGIEIKYDDDLRNTKIVYLSANSDEDNRSLALGHGAETFISKPFKVEDLLRRVDEILHPLGSVKDVPAASAAPAAAPAPVVDAAAKARYLDGLRKKFGGK